MRRPYCLTSDMRCHLQNEVSPKITSESPCTAMSNHCLAAQALDMTLLNTGRRWPNEQMRRGCRHPAPLAQGMCLGCVPGRLACWQARPQAS